MAGIPEFCFTCRGCSLHFMAFEGETRPPSELEVENRMLRAAVVALRAERDLAVDEVRRMAETIEAVATSVRLGE